MIAAVVVAAATPMVSVSVAPPDGLASVKVTEPVHSVHCGAWGLRGHLRRLQHAVGADRRGLRRRRSSRASPARPVGDRDVIRQRCGREREGQGVVG